MGQNPPDRDRFIVGVDIFDRKPIEVFSNQIIQSKLAGVSQLQYRDAGEQLGVGTDGVDRIRFGNLSGYPGEKLIPFFIDRITAMLDTLSEP